MEHYVGTKQLKAKAFTRGQYNSYRGWQVPSNENPDDPGYLVEYLDGGEPNDDRHAGYISWSPKDVFEKSYIQYADAQHQPYQLRILAERAELANKLTKLSDFMVASKFGELDFIEQHHLHAQLFVMGQYLDILDARVAKFS